MANGGRLTVGAENRLLDKDGAAAVGDITPGRYVALTLTDTGAGIPSHVLSRVFEPFYTTKEVGKGSGLGLSQVYGFARQSGGHISIRSDVGRGTSVCLYFPWTDPVDAIGDVRRRPIVSFRLLNRQPYRHAVWYSALPQARRCWEALGERP
jgi:signal transduction histidine kinase